MLFIPDYLSSSFIRSFSCNNNNVIMIIKKQTECAKPVEKHWLHENYTRKREKKFDRSIRNIDVCEEEWSRLEKKEEEK